MSTIIIGSYFAGDIDEDLKHYQHSRYYESLARWVRMVDEIRFMYEHESPEWDALFVQWESTIIESGSFDHRSLQALHDLIAAQYRRHLLDDMPDATSMRKKNGWRDYFKKEAFEFLQEEEFVRQFMTALSGGGSEVGYDAEESMFLGLLEKYGVLLPSVNCD